MWHVIKKLRQHEEKLQILKLLKKSRRTLDDRIIEILPYSKYLKVDENTISLNPKYIDEIKKKLDSFEDLLITDNYRRGHLDTLLRFNNMCKSTFFLSHFFFFESISHHPLPWSF